MSSRVLLPAVALLAALVLVGGLPFQAGRVPAARTQDEPVGDAAPAEPAAPAADSDPFSEAAPATPAADSDPFGGGGPSPFDDKPAADAGEKEEPAESDEPVKPRQVVKPGPAVELRSGEEAILAALKQPASGEFVEAPLCDVVEFLKEVHEITIHIDRRALEDVGIPEDTPITFTASNLPLESLLELMLGGELDLTWTIRSGVLLITTPEQEETMLTTKVYDVSDLLVPRGDRPYHEAIPGTSTGTSREAVWGGPSINLGGISGGGQPAGMGGMGGAMEGGMGGMGGGMGEGFFNIIPVNGGFNPMYPEPVDTYPSNTMDGLIGLITGSVAPESWEDVGGPGTCNEFGRLMVVTQTRSVHKQVETLLDKMRAQMQAQPTVVVDARWLLLDSDQLAELLPAGEAPDGTSARVAVDPQALEKTAREVPGFRGRMTCMSGQKVHVAAGDRRTVVVSAIPVVGSGIGYQPVIAVPNVGVLLEVRPSVEPGGETAMLDVHSTVTRWGEPGPPLQIGGSFPPSQVTEPITGETVDQPGGTASISVDRVNMPTHQLAGTLRVPLGQPVLVGGLTLAPTEDSTAEGVEQERRQLYLVVETSLAASGKRQPPAAASPPQAE